MCPTRELAIQTARECKKLAYGQKFRIKLMKKELVRKADLSKFSCDILISTPLRLRLAIRKKKIDLSRFVDKLILQLMTFNEFIVTIILQLNPMALRNCKAPCKCVVDIQMLLI